MKIFGLGVVVCTLFTGKKELILRLGVWLVKVSPEKGRGRLLRWDRTLPHKDMEPRNEARLDVLGKRFVVCWSGYDS